MEITSPLILRSRPDSAPGGPGLAKFWEEYMKKYQCQVCGYIYDPAEGDPENKVSPNTPFENLPGDWVCPICGATKDQFAPAD